MSTEEQKERNENVENVKVVGGADVVDNGEGQAKGRLAEGLLKDSETEPVENVAEVIVGQLRDLLEVCMSPHVPYKSQIEKFKTKSDTWEVLAKKGMLTEEIVQSMEPELAAFTREVEDALKGMNERKKELLDSPGNAKEKIRVNQVISGLESLLDYPEYIQHLAQKGTAEAR